MCGCVPCRELRTALVWFPSCCRISVTVLDLDSGIWSSLVVKNLGYWSESSQHHQAVPLGFFSYMKNINVSTEFADGFSLHTWKTHCPVSHWNSNVQMFSFQWTEKPQGLQQPHGACVDKTGLLIYRLTLNDISLYFSEGLRWFRY